MNRSAANWRERWADRLGTAAQAVSLVRSGNRVWTGGWTSVPMTLCSALAARHRELSDVEVYTFLTPFIWDRPDVLESFRVVTGFVGPYDRAAVRAGRIDYVPLSLPLEGQMPAGLNLNFDIAMIPISPPDEEGWCSFGGGVFFGEVAANCAKTLIGEVHSEFIRTGGANRIHISRFTRLAEAQGLAVRPPIAPRSEETAAAAEAICTLLALEVIPDRATLQIGVGDVSAALPAFLGEKHDLGIHTEILPGGVIELLKRGVVTNRYKSAHPGKVVAAGLVLMPSEELAELDGHPDVELYDIIHTNDPTLLMRLGNLVAVNNALAVDLTGNVCSEAVGPQLFSGPGGQPSFAIAASVTSGLSVIVLPSSELVGKRRLTRIVAGHPAGSTVTVPRMFVDVVVTEQGVARLRGKTLRQRIGEMIAIAYPDFRGELRTEAKRLYGVG